MQFSTPVKEHERILRLHYYLSFSPLFFPSSPFPSLKLAHQHLPKALSSMSEVKVESVHTYLLVGHLETV